MEKKELDQFYTNPLIAEELIKDLKQFFPKKFEFQFLEPSAGTGNFITALKKLNVTKANIFAYDLEPKADGIKKQDYLKLNLAFSKNLTIIGNPPFGKRGKLALQFLNKGLKEAPVVAMIFPNIFNRYSLQKHVNKNAKLIFSKQIQENAFILNDREYKVKCVFQIWTTELVYSKNLRILEPPKIRHKDFQTWIHNNTKATLKYFDKKKYKWNFAVHRQGYYDYSKNIFQPEQLRKNRQYFFIKAVNKEVLTLIRKKIDFTKLAKTNTQVLGFSTSDFVKEYIKQKNKQLDNLC